MEPLQKMLTEKTKEIEIAKSGKPKIRGIDSLKTSTQHERYVFIVDRKGKHSDSFKIQDDDEKEEVVDDESDSIYFFQPPAPYGEITDYHSMVEVLHLNTMQCLLPNPFHKQHRNVKEEDRYIGATDLCDGKMICVSFHILSDDEIRCYLFVDEKYVRIRLEEEELRMVLGQYVQNKNECDDEEEEEEDVDGDGDEVEDEGVIKECAFSTKDDSFESYLE